jgi:uncharacterized protein YjcR
MTDNPTPPKNKGGAPRGNINALKHGFYSNRVKTNDLAGLEKIKDIDLTEEISIIRIALLRVIEQSDQADTISATLALLHGLCEGSSTLTRLIRTQKMITAEENDVGAALNRALDQVVQEMGIKP